MKNHQNNAMKTRVAGLLLGLLLNAVGNALTISSNTGSAVYTAASVDLFKLTGVNTSIFIFLWGFVNAIINQFLIKKIDVIRFAKGIFFTLFFSYFINIFTNLFNLIGLPNQNWWIRTLFSLIGTFIIGVSISIYQRANLLLHPNDDMTNILRFDYLNGSAIKAQAIDLTLPIVAIVICSILLDHVYAVSIATVTYFLFTGTVIKYTDKWVWPSLIHNF
ncbi:membrane protein [Philodulcilactobacillus myokoensis]|uniref:Membrane protein n=1 Tax=Philodulcilactobacillus myokoensis TaxID=2929573 RepID=A0A9W6B4V2_9LACO|nr:hypothetical protein [Philodulcilactobacillus myokoensis]GLB47534.1 membrane protein [Philodulcilactobacillus myokoensis]